LEGLLARLAAERGVAQVVKAESRLCLDEIDQVLAQPALDDESFSRYVRLNERFHGLLCEMAGSPVIAKELERVARLPFASPSGFVVAQANSGHARDMLIVAQDQHRQVLDARAQAIMCEHSRLAQRNLRQATSSRQLERMPGVRLIRKRGA
jgi:GntR family transcriptional regulator, vanillate catabolism transcriptional regulator